MCVAVPFSLPWTTHVSVACFACSPHRADLVLAGLVLSHFFVCVKASWFSLWKFTARTLSADVYMASAALLLCPSVALLDFYPHITKQKLGYSTFLKCVAIWRLFIVDLQSIWSEYSQNIYDLQIAGLSSFNPQIYVRHCSLLFLNQDLSWCITQEGFLLETADKLGCFPAA